MGLVVTLLFPLGAIVMRVGGNMNAHRVVQMISLVALIVGFGLGIKLAQMRDYVGLPVSYSAPFPTGNGFPRPWSSGAGQHGR